MIRCRPGKSCSTRRASFAPTGLELKASSITLSSPGISCSLCSTGFTRFTPSAISLMVMPSFRAQAQAKTRFEILWRPSSAVSQRTLSPVLSLRVKREPNGPTSTSSALISYSPSPTPVSSFSQAAFSYSLLAQAPSEATMAVPVLGSACRSSNLVAATVRMSPKVSRCWGPMEVIRPMVGFTSTVSSLMSPVWRAPISAMNTWCSGFKRVLISLLKPMGVLTEDSEVNTLYFTESMEASANLVPVFP